MSLANIPYNLSMLLLELHRSWCSVECYKKYQCLLYDFSQCLYLSLLKIDVKVKKNFQNSQVKKNKKGLEMINWLEHFYNTEKNFEKNSSHDKNTASHPNRKWFIKKYSILWISIIAIATSKPILANDAHI